MDKASEAFILKAIEYLQLASDQYSRVPHTQIMRIQNVIEELEGILRRDSNEIL